MGTVKALVSQFGSAECALLPCPGWEAEALFPSATLRVEGIWSVGPCPGEVAGLKSRRNTVCRPVALAALAEKPLWPVHQALQRPANTIAMIDRTPAVPTPRPLCFRLAGELPGAPALLIAHLLSGGVCWVSKAALQARCPTLAYCNTRCLLP